MTYFCSGIKLQMVQVDLGFWFGEWGFLRGLRSTVWGCRVPPILSV